MARCLRALCWLQRQNPTMVGGMLANIGCTVGLVLLNKYLWSRMGFGFVLFLSGCQFAFTGLCVQLLHGVGCVAHKTAAFQDVLPLAVGSLGSVAFMNLNLSLNTVGFYQLSKLLCTPVTILVEYCWLGVRVSRLEACALLMLLAGVGMATVPDLEHNPAGMVAAAVAVVFTVAAQVLTQAKQHSLDLSCLQLLYHVSPIVTCGMFLCVPLLDRLDGGSRGLLEFAWTPAVVGAVLASCALAAAVNVTNYLIIGDSGVITYQVVGYLKTCFILTIGITIFDEDKALVSTRVVVGILLTLAAVLAYGELKRRRLLQEMPQARVEARARRNATRPAVLARPWAVSMPSNNRDRMDELLYGMELGGV